MKKRQGTTKSRGQQERKDWIYNKYRSKFENKGTLLKGVCHSIATLLMVAMFVTPWLDPMFRLPNNMAS